MKNNKDDEMSWLPIGMCLGLSLGTAVGCSTDNLSVCMCVGIAVGVAVGALLDHNNKNQD